MIDLNEDNIKKLFRAYENRHEDIKWNPSNYKISKTKCFDNKNDIEFELKVILIEETAKDSNYSSMKPTTYEEVDPNAFNFTKIKKSDIIISSNKREVTFHEFKTLEISLKDDDDVIIPNHCPINFYHCLFLPFYNKILPQYIDRCEIIYRVLRILELFACNDLIIGFNSKGALSSINHLHFHLYFLRNHKETTAEIYLLNPKINKKIAVLALGEENNLNFFKNTETFILNFYRISYDCISDKPSLIKISNILIKIINIFNELNIAYNLVLISKNIFIFPRKHEILTKNKSFAYIELLGILVFYEHKEYELNEYQKDLLDLQINDEIIFNQIHKIINDKYN